VKNVNRFLSRPISRILSRFHRSNTFLAFLLLSIICFLLGCDTKPVASNKTSGTEAAPRGQAKDQAIPALVENSANSAVTETHLKAEVTTAEVTTADELEATKIARPIREEVAKPTGAEPKLIVPVAKLTAEQEMAWAWPAYEKLELLKYKEWPMAGLVTCTAQTKDGRSYILAGNKVALWSVDGDEPEHVFLDLSLQGNKLFIKSMAISSDGKRLAVGDSEGTMTIWSLDDRKEIISKKLYSNDIVDMAISPDSQEIATMSFGKEVAIWSADTLESNGKFKLDSNSVSQIEYLRIGSLLIFGEKAMVIRTQDGTKEKEVPSGRYHKTVARSDDGKTVVTSTDDQLQLWTDDLTATGAIAGSFAQQEHIAFSPDGKLLATANGSTLRLWDLENRRPAQFIDTEGSAIVGLQWLKEPDVLVVANDFGQTRIWATVTTGAKHGLQPLHKPIVGPDPSQRVPPLVSQMTSMIDLRTLPIIPGSKASVVMESNVSYTTPLSVDDAKLFYRYHLGQRGWMEKTEASANPAAIEFRKDGSMLSASFYDAGGTGTSVHLNHHGSYDMRWTPRVDGETTKVSYESEHIVHYESKATLLELETQLFKKLFAAGWTGYSRLHSSHNEELDRRSMTFIQNGMELRVSIGKFPATPDSYTIQYTPFPATNSLPIPKDSGFVELEHAKKPHLVATTSMSLSETQAFYDTEMQAQGWLPKKSGRSIKDDHVWLSYFQGQNDVVIGLVKMENGRTLVRVGEQLENSSWQLAKPKEEKPSAAPLRGIEAIDFPILNSSKQAKYDARAKTIEFVAEKIRLSDLAEQYTKAMEAIGWQIDKFGVRSEEYTMLPCKKDDKEITVRSVARDGNAEVNISGDGLLWNKPLPGGKQIISYETWMRDNRHPAGLELLDKYQAEMQAIEQEKK
jgi:WD40 repeat protein